MKVLILDAYNLIHRARFASARGPQGEHTMTYVFFRSLRPIIEKFSPDRAYFVLEGSPRARLEMQPDYKGTRDRAHDEGFNRQKKEIINLLSEYFPMNVVYHPDFEADDTVANLISHRHSEDDVTIVSSDTDFIQLLDNYPNVGLWNPIQKKYRQGVGVDYVRWKALRGDGADNIIGFHGIGDKRAKTLIESPVKLQAFLDSDPGNVTKFEHNVEMIKFHEWPDMKGMHESVGSPDWSALRQVFTNCRFFSITKESSWLKFIKTFECLLES